VLQCPIAGDATALVTGKCLSECYVDSVSVIRFIPFVFQTEPCRLLLQFLITAITADVFCQWNTTYTR